MAAECSPSLVEFNQARAQSGRRVLLPSPESLQDPEEEAFDRKIVTHAGENLHRVEALPTWCMPSLMYGLHIHHKTKRISCIFLSQVNRQQASLYVPHYRCMFI